MEQNTQKLFYRVSTVAQMLDITRSKAYQLIEQGEIRAARIGKSIRVPAEALERFSDLKKAEGIGA